MGKRLGDGPRRHGVASGAGAMAPSPAWCSVVSFDPGTTTGWCVSSVHPSVFEAGAVLTDGIKHFAYGEINRGSDISGEVSSGRECVELCDAWPEALVVCEDFILRTRTKAREALSPVRITAMIQYGVHPRKVVLQQPSMAMSTITDDRLKRMGLYDAHSGGHARDAVRHNLLTLRRAADSPRVRTGFWPWTRDLTAAVRKAGRRP